MSLNSGTNNQPIYADASVSDINSCVKKLDNAKCSLSAAINSISTNLNGVEFELACSYIKKNIIDELDNITDEINKLLAKITSCVNEYNKNLVDEEGNPLKPAMVNYVKNFTSNINSKIKNGGISNYSTLKQSLIPNDVTTVDEEPIEIVEDNFVTKQPTILQNASVIDETFISNASDDSSKEESLIPDVLESNETLIGYNDESVTNIVDNNQNEEKISTPSLGEEKNSINTQSYNSPSNYEIKDSSQIIDSCLNSNMNINYASNSIIIYGNNSYRWEDVMGQFLKENRLDEYINKVSILGNNMVSVKFNDDSIVTFNNVNSAQALINIILNYFNNK